MGVYQDMVSNAFGQAQTALGQQIGNEKNAGAAQTAQSNLAYGVTGSAATALKNQNSRLIGNQGTQQLLNLGTQARQAQYQAFGQDRQEAINQQNATNQLWMQGITGAGSLLGTVGKLWLGGGSGATATGGTPGTSF